MPTNLPDIRTGEIDEILGKTPGSLVSWGITVFFVIIALFITASWFFKYPDVVHASIEITGNLPPADIKARTSGKIDTFFVINNQKVHEDQVLGLVENPADYSEIVILKTHLNTRISQWQANDSLNEWDIPISVGKLGELQVYYSAFTSAQHAYISYKEIDYYKNKINTTQLQLTDYRTLYDFTNEQLKTLKSDFELASKDYKRYVKLFDDQVIPEQELEKAQSQYLNRKLAFESIRTNMANIQIQISQMQSTIAEYEMLDKQQHESLYSALVEAGNNLKAQLEIWEQKYVLKTPQAGKCVFTKYWAKNQNLNVNETVFTILPDSHGALKGMLLLPAEGAGKVEPGQKVNIRLDNYPYMEYGMLEGVISHISEIPDEGVYYATVIFPAGLKTSYGKEFVFKQRLKGTAEIITNDIRLFHRVLQPLKHIIFDKT